MKRLFWFTLMLAALLTLAILPVAAQENEGPPQVGLRPDAPTYAVHGPYWVGVHEFTLDAEHREKPLQMVAWYPALNPEGMDEVITYLAINQVDTEEGYPSDIYGHALRDAAPDMIAAPYPVILLSHGFADWPFHIAWLGEHLASYGFVVLAPAHRELLIFSPEEDWSGLADATIQRPLDMQTIFANLDTLNQNGFLEGVMNTEVIGATGFSYGGMTTLAVGGARLALNEFAARCAGLPSGEAREGICTLLLSNRERLVELAGLETEPEGLWPAWTDPRVKAIAPLAANSSMFAISGLTEITVPMLSMVGEGDEEHRLDALDAYPSVSSTEKALVIFDHATHFIFEVTCDAIPSWVEWGIFSDCSNPVWDMLRGHDLINHLETAFFLAELKGDAEARAALAPDAVTFPGIEYQAEGF